MATMNEVVEYVDRIKPNIYTDDDKYRWINTVEGLIGREVLQEDVPTYALPDDADKQLLVPHPYDDLYRLYVLAMIDQCSGDEGYDNSVLAFEERYKQYRVWYIRNHDYSKAQFKNLF